MIAVQYFHTFFVFFTVDKSRLLIICVLIAVKFGPFVAVRISGWLINRCLRITDITILLRVILRLRISAITVLLGVVLWLRISTITVLLGVSAVVLWITIIRLLWCNGLFLNFVLSLCLRLGVDFSYFKFFIFKCDSLF